VVFFHTGLHSNYHKSTDTPDKLNYEGMQDVARYGFELAWRIASLDRKPVTIGIPKPMYPTHDHDHPGVKFPDEDNDGPTCKLP
jgi:hypothetical protein